MQRAIRQLQNRFAFILERKEFVPLRTLLLRRRFGRSLKAIRGTLPPARHFERKIKPHQILVHVSHGPGSHQCVCNCPDGPCEHVWDGPTEEGDNYHSATCSKCGKSAISHDMWVF